MADVHYIYGSGGSGPHDVRRIDGRLNSIETTLARMEGKLEALSEKIDARPTIWTLTIALVSAVLASGTLSLAIVRFALT